MAGALPRYAWYGDDFTGSTDTLSVLAEGGQKALLFLRIPTPEQLARAGDLDALGIAGATRAMAPEAMAAELDPAGRFFAGLGIALLHYKCCSTFDSAPHLGSIGAAVRALQPHFPNSLLPIIGGQPNLGRYCLFGHLFAAAGDGAVHRIDRHPTMSRHPVTPMAESDLRRHLALQGLGPIALVDYRELEGQVSTDPDGADVTLFDVSRESDLAAIAWRLRSRIEAAPSLLIGPSSVARMAAQLWDRPKREGSPQPVMRSRGPVLALVGSLSPVTRAQVEAAEGFERLPVDPVRLRDEPAYGEMLRDRALQALGHGDTMLVTASPDRAPDDPRAVARATAGLLRAVMDRARIARLLVAGGDTATLAMEALDLWGLSYLAPLVEGAPLCRIHSTAASLDGLEVVLKGGQMGPPAFFALASA